jgi:CO dehydrogenase/acetyl-CoA synthase alpha subunit
VIAELNRIAAACDMAGGHVRNAALAAAAAARRAGTPIVWTHHSAAIAAELRKLGNPPPR